MLFLEMIFYHEVTHPKAYLSTSKNGHTCTCRCTTAYLSDPAENN